MKAKDQTGMTSVPVVIALFNGNHGEDPMCVLTNETAIWDKNRKEVVFSLQSPDAWVAFCASVARSIDESFIQPPPTGDPIPDDPDWQPPGWSKA